MAKNQPTFSDSWVRTLGQTGSTPTKFVNPQQALLDTIRYAEGTWNGSQLGGGSYQTGSPQGFNVIQGYGRFSDTSRHPRKLGPLSDAAGAYQIISPTDEAASRLVGTTDFSPIAQGNKALALARERMLRANLGGLSYLNKNGLDDKVISALTNEWASFPGNSYGQPTKKAEDLKKFYNERMALLQGGQVSSSNSSESNSTTTASEPATPTSPTITENDDGTQTVSVPGGVTVNLKINNGEEKKKDVADLLRETFKAAALKGAGGVDLSALVNKKLYPNIDDVLA